MQGCGFVVLGYARQCKAKIILGRGRDGSGTVRAYGLRQDVMTLTGKREPGLTNACTAMGATADSPAPPPAA